jgi:hypothetical protein
VRARRPAAARAGARGGAGAERERRAVGAIRRVASVAGVLMREVTARSSSTKRDAVG